MEVKDLKASALKGVDEEQESSEQVTAGNLSQFKPTVNPRQTVVCTSNTYSINHWLDLAIST